MAAFAIIASYLLGSIPFGLLIVRWLKGVDVRQVGSGNIGATNAARAAGRGAGIAVFLLDGGKGALAAASMPALGRALFGTEPTRIGPEALAVACACAAVAGHCFSLFLGFRGGKGVATGCGALLALDPRLFLAGGLVWLATMLLTRWVSLASMAMGLAFPIAAWWLGGPARTPHTLGTALLAILILARHRSNIMRLVAGTEPKAFSKRTRASDAPTAPRPPGTPAAAARTKDPDHG